MFEQIERIEREDNTEFLEIIKLFYWVDFFKIVFNIRF